MFKCMLTFFTFLEFWFICCIADTDTKCSLTLVLISFELHVSSSTFTVTVVTCSFFSNHRTEIFKSLCVTLIALLGCLGPFCS